MENVKYTQRFQDLRRLHMNMTALVVLGLPLLIAFVLPLLPLLRRRAARQRKARSQPPDDQSGAGAG